MFHLNLLGLFKPSPSGRKTERFAMLRYHGLWGPGVRLLQNMRFRNKALLLVICLVLPIGLLAAQAWQSSRAGIARVESSITALQAYRLVAAEHEAIGELYQALDTVAPAAALQKEQQAASVMAQALDGMGADQGMKEALASFSHTRQTVFARLGAERGKAAAMGVVERDEALALLERQANGLRARLLTAKGAALREQARLSSLAEGGLGRLPSLTTELRQSVRLLERMQTAGSPQAAVALLESLAMAQQMLDLCTLGLQPAIALGGLDAGLARGELAKVGKFLDSTRQRARASLVADVATQGESPSLGQALQSGWQAVRSAQALHQHVLQRVGEDLSVRDREEQAELVGAMGVTAAGIGLMVYFLVCLNKVVGGGLRELSLRVEALARGDLSEKPVARGSDEVGTAMNALGESVRRMASLLEAVTQGVAAVSHASREVATGNAGLSGRTGDIRRSIGDVGERARSSMEAMNRAGDEVERIAEHMREVRSDAYRSRKAMSELQALMRNLQGKSREIGRVVQLVESVAHQTRLLSLNASVEAARAGTAGKGFGVVAQEVRDLARRSESAAQKIAEIVQASVNEIDAGGLLTERVGESVRLTDERVAEVSSIMGDIVRLTHSGREHSQEVVGITRNVEDSAGGNARMVEQLAQASADLREQGDNLRRSLQHFVFG